MSDAILKAIEDLKAGSVSKEAVEAMVNDAVTKAVAATATAPNYADEKKGIALNLKFGTLPITPEALAFCKWMVSGERGEHFKAQRVNMNDVALKAVNTDTSNAAGGYLVPTELAREIIRKEAAINTMRGLARIFPMGSDKVNLPSQANGVTTYWTAQGAALTASDPTFGQLSLDAKKLTALTYITTEAEEDAVIALAEYVTDLIHEALSDEEDKQFWTGAAASATTPEGFVNSALITANVAQATAGAGNFKWTDLVALEYTLPRKYRPGSAYVMADADEKKVHSFVDAQNRPLYTTDVVNGEKRAFFGGYPIIVPKDVAAGTVFFGRLKNYIIGDRRRLAVARTSEGAGTFENDTTAIKATTRIDGKFALGEAAAKLTGVA